MKTELLGGGQSNDADQGHTSRADVEQPKGARKGQVIPADKANELAPSASRRHTNEPLPVTLAARKAFADAGGDIERAVEALIATADDGVRNELISRGARIAIADVMSTQRTAVWNGHGMANRADRAPAYFDPEARKAQVIALAKSNLLAFLLPGGEPLGEATAPRVRQAAQFYAVQSAGYAEKQRWLTLIVAALPDDKTVVRRVLDNDKLQALRLKAVEMARAA